MASMEMPFVNTLKIPQLLLQDQCLQYQYHMILQNCQRFVEVYLQSK